MKFTSVRLVGLSTVTLNLFGASPADPYLFKGADGLGPSAVDVNIDSFFHGDGVYGRVQPQNKELVIRIGLNPDYGVDQTPDELREVIYAALSPVYGRETVIELWDGVTKRAFTSGFMKKVEPILFTKTPEVQVTIGCASPHWKSDAIVLPAGLSKSAPTLVNPGTTPSGFIFEMAFTSTVTSFTLTDVTHGAHMLINHSIPSGWTLLINTVPGEEDIALVGGDNLVDYLSDDSEWLRFHSGTNLFSTSSSAFNWVQKTYQPLYLGV